MLTPRRHRAVAGAVLLTLAAALSGCSLLTHPPAEVTAAIDRATQAIRQSAGVAGATSEIRPRDLKDGGPLSNPGAWTATITVDADESGVDVRALAESVGRNATIGIVSTTALLRIPGEDGAADAQLNFTPLPDATNIITEPDEMADAVLALRELAGARSVAVFDHGDPATITADTDRWADLTASVRALPDFGLNALSAITLRAEADGNEGGAAWLTIDASSPTVDFVRFLGELSADKAVESVLFTGVDIRRDLAAQRPDLWVEVATAGDVDTVAGMLTALDVSQTTVAGVPRASFTVSTRSDSARRETGYLGLPPGSAEPDDRFFSTPNPAAADDFDPVAAADQLQRDRAVVTALLDAAGDAAGIRGPATVTIGPCATGADQQVQGSVVIPIFEIADSADEAFDAITTGWERQGIRKSDRAMGTDFYSAADKSLDTLSIRGGTEGISISVATRCVLSG
ncbi:hypothetical protein E3T61_19365 [Cryobacterium lactosi]|uniref:Uncharacterized protein n=1 Tax=Cryobacterium lactosi TaxID=1259202 RepID=A0A4R9BJ43_9MICO|nr:hypothetical protein [Cryobacterium lactosi]TFD84387.1 hypothetical protein E3T61_19365 [Cryobacterium lactosi]